MLTAGLALLRGRRGTRLPPAPGAVGWGGMRKGIWWNRVGPEQDGGILQVLVLGRALQEGQQSSGTWEWTEVNAANWGNSPEKCRGC